MGAGKKIQYKFANIADMAEKFQEGYDTLKQMQTNMSTYNETLLNNLASEGKEALNTRMKDMNAKFLSCLEELKSISDSLQEGNAFMEEGDKDLGDRIRRK